MFGMGFFLGGGVGAKIPLTWSSQNPLKHSPSFQMCGQWNIKYNIKLHLHSFWFDFKGQGHSDLTKHFFRPHLLNSKANYDKFHKNASMMRWHLIFQRSERQPQSLDNNVLQKYTFWLLFTLLNTIVPEQKETVRPVFAQLDWYDHRWRF